MPYVEGESLRARLARQGELPVHDAVKILIEVTDALAYAHGRGVVHRDIKPDNVLLSGRHALVTDFGVAKAVSEATGRQQLTTAGVALGTPAYMAPEQATADPGIDHRADIYALGVMGYELIAGRPPFIGRTSAGGPGGAGDAAAAAARRAAADLPARARGGPDEVPGETAGRSLAVGRRAARPARAAPHTQRRHDADDDPAPGSRGAGCPPETVAEVGRRGGDARRPRGRSRLLRHPPAARGAAGPPGAAHAGPGYGDRPRALARRRVRRLCGGATGADPAVCAAGGRRNARGTHAGGRRVRPRAPVVARRPAAPLRVGARPRGHTCPRRPLEAHHGLGARRLGGRQLVAGRALDRLRPWRLGVRPPAGAQHRPGRGPAARGPLLRLVPRRAPARLRLGQPQLHEQRGVRQSRREQRVARARRRRRSAPGHR